MLPIYDSSTVRSWLGNIWDLSEPKLALEPKPRPLSPAQMMRSISNIKRTPSMSETQTGPVKPLRDILAAVSDNTDLDSAHIIAGAFNLYSESLRRTGRRQHLAAEDIFKIFSMVDLLLGAGDLDAGMKAIAGQFGGKRREVQ